MVYDLVGITPIPSGTQFLVNWESPQTGVKDYAQCSLPGSYILSSGQNIIDIVVIKLHYQHLL